MACCTLIILNNKACIKEEELQKPLVELVQFLEFEG